MAIQYVGGTSDNSGATNVTSFTPVYPTGWKNGDVLCFYLLIDSASVTGFAQTSGTAAWHFVEVAANATGGYFHAFGYYEAANVADTLPVFSWTTAANISWSCSGITSDVNGSKLSVGNFANGDPVQNSVAGTSITPNSTNSTSPAEDDTVSLIYTLAKASAAAATSSHTYTPPSGWTWNDGDNAFYSDASNNAVFAAHCYMLGAGHGVLIPSAETLTDSASDTFFFAVAHLTCYEQQPGIKYRDSVAGNSDLTATTAQTATFPATTAAGDFCVLMVLNDATISGTWSQTGGSAFTSANHDRFNVAINATVWYRIATGGDVGPTITCSQSARMAWLMIVFTPWPGSRISIDVWATDLTAAASTTYTPNSVTAAIAGEVSLILNAARESSNGINAIAFIPPSNYIAPANAFSGYGGASAKESNSISAAYALDLGPGLITPGVETLRAGSVVSPITTNAVVYHVLLQEQPPPNSFVPVVSATPGRSWLRRFHHGQQQRWPISAPSFTLPLTDAGTGSMTAIGGGSDTPQLPLQAQPGQAWLRRFKLRVQQIAPPQPVVVPAFTAPLSDSGASAIAAAGSKGSGAANILSDAGASTDALAGGGNDTPQLPLQAALGTTWLRRYRHRQQPAQFISVATQPPGQLADTDTTSILAAGSKGAIGLLADTGASLVSPAGAGSDTPVLPLSALPGRTWLRAYQHSQQAAPLPLPVITVPVADAGTGTITAAGSKGTTGLLTDAGTGTITVPGGGGDSAQLPARAWAGTAWLRAFQHRLRPAQFISVLTLPPGTLADSGTAAITVAGAKSTSGLLADAGTGTIAVPGSGGDTPVLPQTAQPGVTWLKAYKHRQQPAQVSGRLTLPPAALADAGTATIVVLGGKGTSGLLADAGTGTVVPAGSGNDTPLLPAAALAGKTWLRYFKPRQRPAQVTSVLTLPPGPLADTGVSTITVAGSKAVTGIITDSGAGVIFTPETPASVQSVMPSVAAPGQVWLRHFRTRQQAQPVPVLTLPPGALADASAGTMIVAGAKGSGTANVLSDAGTSAIVPAGSGADTAVLPQSALPGRQWLRFYRHPQQTALPVPPSLALPVTDAGTGTMLVIGGGSDTPQLPQSVLPGQAWLRYFRHQQQSAPLPLQSVARALADAGTGTMSVAGSKAVSSLLADGGTAVVAPAGAGADVFVLPLTAAVGLTWLRYYRHRQQPAQTVSVTAAQPPGSIADTNTGTIQVTGLRSDVSVMPLAAPGRAWLSHFRHAQQSASTLPPAFTIPVADAGTAIITAAGSKGTSGSLAVMGTGTLADTAAKGVTGTEAVIAAGLITPAGSGADTPVLPRTALAGASWLRRYQHRQQPALYVSSFAANTSVTSTGVSVMAGSKAVTGSCVMSGTITQVSAGIKNAATVLAIFGTSSISVPGAGADVLTMPHTAAPGIAWIRHFRRSQQSYPVTPPPPIPANNLILFTASIPRPRWITGIPVASWSAQVPRALR